MSSVLQLLRVYFTGTALSRQVSAVSAVLLAIVLGSRFVYPEFGQMFQTGYMPDASPALKVLIAVAPVLAVFGLFFGAFMLPVVLGELATTRRLHTLPHGPVAVVASAVVCVTLLAAAYTAIYAWYVPAIYRDDLLVFSGALGGYTLLYLVLWLVARSRTAFGKLAASMLLIGVVAAPAVIGPRTGVVERLIGTFALWAVIALAIGRLKRSPGPGEALKTWLARLGGVRASGSVSETERIDALVGTANPWLVAFGPVLPFSVAMVFVRTPEGWLFYLTLFAMLAGAIASVAARRSRALWLRTHRSRGELFALLERAFWRQNRYALIVLALAHAAISLYFALPLRTAALGIPALGLAATTSTYLGLMMTRQIHWAEVLLTLATMTLVMTTAVSIADAGAGLEGIAAQMLVLLVAALVFRAVARRRWHGIDWALTNASPESR